MIHGIGRLKTYARRVRYHLSPGAIILLYHRVGEPDRDPQLLSVSRRNFEAQMAVLRSYKVASLQTLTGSKGGLGGGIAVTFDDGYVDNLRNAKPLLQKYAIPATVFVSVSHVRDGKPFWWDEVQRILLDRHPLPEVLSLTLAGKRFEWFLGDSGQYREASLRHRKWNLLSPSDPTPRHTAYRDVCKLLRPLTDERREMALHELRQAAGLSAGVREACTPAELRALHDPDLVEIGAHTCTHPVLSRLPVADQRQEIVESKLWIEAELGAPVNSFSYPFGGREDYGAESVEEVRRCGFRYACSNFEGYVRRSTDPHQLPRFLVRDWDADTFAHKLKGWFRG